MAFSSNTFKYLARVIQNEGKIVYEYNPLYNYRKTSEEGLIGDLVTEGDSQLNFDLEHPVEIDCQRSYDGSVNLIINDDKNLPRLVNTRFTVKLNNTYTREDRLGNTDTNLYDESEFEIDTSLLKKYINIPKVNFNGVFYGGSLPVGNYVFYFKLSDADGNETDIVAESGLVTIHMGALNTPQSIRGGLENENSGKLVLFTLTNIDSGYDYVTVYYSRSTGVDNKNRTVTATLVLNRYRVRQTTCNVHITGTEEVKSIPVANLSQDFFLAAKAKTLAICLNMLFLGNVTKYTPSYETLSRLSLGFVPYYESTAEEKALGSVVDLNYSAGGYYDTKNIYHKVGYWNEELYRFGVVYIMGNGSLSPVYNIRGINNVPKLGSGKSYESYKTIAIDYDTLLINEATMENSAGVCRIFEELNQNDNYFRVRNFVFLPQSGVIDALKKENIKGYFFVRLKRIPTILCQAFMIGRDTYSGIPAWKIIDSSNKSMWVTESFLDSRGCLTLDYSERMIQVDDSKAQTSVGLCPEYFLNQAYFNSIFTGADMPIKQVTKEGTLLGETNHMFLVESIKPSSTSYSRSHIISVPEDALARDGANIFRTKAGNPEELTFQYVCNKSNKPVKKNFSQTKTRWRFVNGHIALESWDTANKVRIVRGSYSTYLGFYKNNSLQPNSLVNIYIPGYDVSLLLEYFKLRINCEDPYYAVTLRTPIDQFPSAGEKIYRGDCYICNFTQRLNKNFQDPDAPNNDVIVSEDTWRENYNADKGQGSDVNRGDINAVKLGTYFTFKCYSSWNLGMRDFDRAYPSEEALTGNKRSFYPLQPLRVDGHSKIPESTIFNQGLATSVSEKVNFLQPPVPFIKNTFLTRIVYSDVAQTDAFKNGFRIFRGVSFRDYSNQYGGIMKILEWGGHLMVIFEHAIAIAQVNLNALIPTDDGTKIAVGAVKVLSDTLLMISTDYGTQWPESICVTENYVYGIDTVAKKIWRTNGSSTFECISDFRVQKFLNDNITLGERELTPIIGVRNVKTHYNAYKKDVMFTYYDNTYGFEETVWNLCYNELQQAFTTFYSWVPSYSANIDNIFFSYDRNSSKWISKLGMSTIGSGNESGVCCTNTQISGTSFSTSLSFKNRPLPTDDLTKIIYDFKLERDHWGYYKYFNVSGNTLTLTNYEGLKKLMFTSNGKIKDPIIPCILLNIKCDISVSANGKYSQAGSKETWEKFKIYNLGYYQSQVFLTFADIVTNKTISTIEKNTIKTEKKNKIVVNGLTIDLPSLETDFWKHGFAGLIDVLDKIKPCFWYGKQHPFEFEYIAGNDTAGYKQFTNLIISSNNVKPESIHYTIIGDSYDFSDLKPSMYFRLEATKALYQYNGSDILYDHKVFDKVTGFLPQLTMSSTYIEKDEAGNSLRHSSAVSNIYRDTMMPWIYTKQDTFNEVEDFYKLIVATKAYADYPNITGGEIIWDSQLNQFSICNHVKARDIKEVGRTRGNVQYVNDKWMVLITPLNVLNRNFTWGKDEGTLDDKFDLPKLVLSNIPKEVFEYTQGLLTDNSFPPELGRGQDTSKYVLDGHPYGVSLLDGTPWDSIANARKEVKLMDKHLKTRIRYKGDKLAIILATVTQFNTIG